LGGFRLFWAEMGYFFQSATLYAHFSDSKRGKMFYVWLILDCFGLKQEIFFKVQLYSLTFRNRKSDKRFSRLKRRRESVATWRILPTETKYASKSSKILVLRCPQNCDAKSPRDRRADGVGI